MNPSIPGQLGYLLLPGATVVATDLRTFALEDIATFDKTGKPATITRHRPLTAAELQNGVASLPQVGTSGGMVSPMHGLFFRPYTKDDLPPGALPELAAAQAQVEALQQQNKTLADECAKLTAANAALMQVIAAKKA